jgi:hypothetical protein
LWPCCASVHSSISSRPLADPSTHTRLCNACGTRYRRTNQLAAVPAQMKDGMRVSLRKRTVTDKVASTAAADKAVTDKTAGDGSGGGVGAAAAKRAGGVQP